MSTTEGELDVEVAADREEGEIEDSDVEDGTYNPLPRPDTLQPPSLVHMQIQDEVSDEESLVESTGSDSDDEVRKRPKRTKLRIRRPPQPVQTQQDRKKKYNIWCTALQEDLLTENMNGCDVTRNKEYGVESYDYTIKYKLKDKYVKRNNPFTDTGAGNNRSDDHSNKRRFSDRGDVKHRLGKRVNSHKLPEEKMEPRILADLIVKPEDSFEVVGLDIAEKLSEEKSDLVVKIVEVIGVSKAIELYKKTQTVEADGGMLIMNGRRRRTPGGIYFLLLKRDDDISQDMVNQIFTEDRKETTRKLKKARVKSRQKVMEQLKQSLTDSELPSLLSRGEATQVRTEHGSNPPPSPATDARDCSSDTDAPAQTSPPASRRYSDEAAADDDYLDAMCNEDMDLF